jgi:hypothetical protein
MATAKVTRIAYIPVTGSFLFITVVRTQVKSESAAPEERSNPPATITTAWPMARRMSGVKALMFLTMDLTVKKLSCKVAVITNMIMNIKKLETSGFSRRPLKV